MDTGDLKRKLTAVFSADVAEYSRLMGEDERATVDTITSYRSIMAEHIRAHNGRVVDAKGDNVLAEFPSVVDAVQCAVEVQKELDLKNVELPERRRMAFRIGVNLGDVIEKGDTIYGDGVNIAARMESLAEGGGICISGTAFDQVGKKLSLGYKYLGEQKVKNIEKPIRAYKVLVEPEAAGKVIGERQRLKMWHWTAIFALVVLIAVGGSLALWEFYVRPDVAPASIEKMAYPLPDKPSIAVLAFDNMTGDPKKDYFSEGISEEIIRALSSVPELFVIARNSSFTYKGKPVNVKQVAEDLGIQYVLEGSVRESGGRVRITAQLIDALTGRHLWAETYDRNMEDIFALQDEITMKIITELRVKVRGSEEPRGSEPCTTNLKAYLKYLEAMKHFVLINKEDNLLAQRLYKEAIALEPSYACAYSGLGGTYLLEVYLGSSTSPQQSIATAKQHVDKAIALNPSLSGPHSMLAFIYRTIGQHEKAIEQAEKALSVDPNSFFSLRELASCLRSAGRYEEAIPLYENQIRGDPFFSYNYWMLGVCYFHTRRFEDAIRMFSQATDRNPKDIFARIYLTAAYAAAGREEESRASAKELLKMDPTFTAESSVKRFALKRQEDKELLFASLLKAGVK